MAEQITTKELANRFYANVESADPNTKPYKDLFGQLEKQFPQGLGDRELVRYLSTQYPTLTNQFQIMDLETAPTKETATPAPPAERSIVANRPGEMISTSASGRAGEAPLDNRGFLAAETGGGFLTRPLAEPLRKYAKVVGTAGKAVAAKAMVPSAVEAQAGAMQGLMEMGIDATAPANLALLGASFARVPIAIASKAPKLFKMGRALFQTGLTASALGNLGAEVPEAVEALQRGDHFEAGRATSKALADLLLVGGMIPRRRGVRPPPPDTSRAVTGSFAEPPVGQTPAPRRLPPVTVRPITGEFATPIEGRTPFPTKIPVTGPLTFVPQPAPPPPPRPIFTIADIQAGIASAQQRAEQLRSNLAAAEKVTGKARLPEQQLGRMRKDLEGTDQQIALMRDELAYRQAQGRTEEPFVRRGYRARLTPAPPVVEVIPPERQLPAPAAAIPATPAPPVAPTPEPGVTVVQLPPSAISELQGGGAKKAKGGKPKAAAPAATPAPVAAPAEPVPVVHLSPESMAQLKGELTGVTGIPLKVAPSQKKVVKAAPAAKPATAAAAPATTPAPPVVPPVVVAASAPELVFHGKKVDPSVIHQAVRTADDQKLVNIAKSLEISDKAIAQLQASGTLRAEVAARVTKKLTPAAAPEKTKPPATTPAPPAAAITEVAPASKPTELTKGHIYEVGPNPDPALGLSPEDRLVYAGQVGKKHAFRYVGLDGSVSNLIHLDATVPELLKALAIGR